MATLVSARKMLSHAIALSLRRSWSPRPTSGKAMTRFVWPWVLCGTAAAVSDAAARPKLGRRSRTLGLFAVPRPHDPHELSLDLTGSSNGRAIVIAERMAQSVWQHAELTFAVNSA
jgi:hypothetical protein